MNRTTSQDQGRTSASIIRKNIKPKAVIKAQNAWNKVLWTLKKDKPNYFDGTLPTDVIGHIFAWTDPSIIKKYRFLCHSINDAVITASFAAHNLSAFVPRDYNPDVGHKLDREWTSWLDPHRLVFTEIYLSSMAPKARAISGKWKWSQLRSQTTLMGAFLQNLDGSIPTDIENLAHLVDLDLSCNRFNGPIPHAIGTLTSLEKICFKSNKLSGVIPDELHELQSLRMLDFSKNQLEGSINRARLTRRCDIALDFENETAMEQKRLALEQKRLDEIAARERRERERREYEREEREREKKWSSSDYYSSSKASNENDNNSSSNYTSPSDYYMGDIY
ncbi:UNVERIFIED_CONTAM: hypothetical protein HDU68_008904 [Siphonaria sp. JEL0065]|nr:hypothetical protein HDU68_008904 [Siphonaria sp. JEL0065]